MEKFKAGTYERISYSDDKNMESDSIANQQKLIADFVAAHNDIEVVRDFKDDGYSGIVFQRPGFQEMLTAIEKREINCVIVKDLSRFGREYIETGKYLERFFPANGVRFIAITDNIDTAKSSVSGDLTTSLKTIINDTYCRDISVKTRSALRVKRSNGEYVGALPVYGYKKSASDKHRLVIDEYAANIVRDIFRWKINGMSAYKIASKLNALGILSPIEYKKANGIAVPRGGCFETSSAKWSATTIFRILNDRTYLGMLVQGKSATVNYKVKELKVKPEEEWVVAKNTHEAIISELDFELVQKIMRLDTRTTPNGNSVYTFSGVVICGCCGARMRRRRTKYKGVYTNYLFCPTGKNNGCSDTHLIREDVLENVVLSAVKSQVQAIVKLDELLSQIDAANITAKAAEQYVKAMTENQTKLNEITAYRSRLYENYINGVLNKENYKTLKKQYSDECTQLQAAIAELKQNIQDITEHKSERMKWIELFKQFDGIESLDRRVVSYLIQSITVHNKKNIHIVFKYADEFEKAMSLADELMMEDK